MIPTESSTRPIRSLNEINNLLIKDWTREEVLHYPLLIQEKMSNWEACKHVHPSGLVVTTTPNPNPSIRITDLVGRILFKNP